MTERDILLHVFPDPEGMLRRLKEKGLKICVCINAYT
jgi:alpha-glucosidase (family GH31 glycosyl hydrolase)